MKLTDESLRVLGTNLRGHVILARRALRGTKYLHCLGVAVIGGNPKRRVQHQRIKEALWRQIRRNILCYNRIERQD